MRQDSRSQEARRYRPWYWTQRWRKLSHAVRQQEPLCRMCAEAGHITPATLVDHIKPHKGDAGLFWDVSNLQPLCDDCHTIDKARIEARGYSSAVDQDGWPLDGRHPANR